MLLSFGYLPSVILVCIRYIPHMTSQNVHHFDCKSFTQSPKYHFVQKHTHRKKKTKPIQIQTNELTKPEKFTISFLLILFIVILFLPYNKTENFIIFNSIKMKPIEIRTIVIVKTRNHLTFSIEYLFCRYDANIFTHIYLVIFDVRWSLV